MKEVNKLNDTIAQQYTIFITRRFMLLTLSKDQTVSLLWFGELLVIMIKNDLYVNFRRATRVTSSSCLTTCVPPLDTPPHMAFR